jgi:flagellar basal body rod protein FlgF
MSERLREKDALLREKDALLREKDTRVKDKDAQIAVQSERLRRAKSEASDTMTALVETSS